MLICLSTHISVGFWRRGNTMEVIDDCLALIPGILWRHFLEVSKCFQNKKDLKKKTWENLKNMFYLSLSTCASLYSQSWVPCIPRYSWVVKVPPVVLNSSHSNQVWSCVLLLVALTATACLDLLFSLSTVDPSLTVTMTLTVLDVEDAVSTVAEDTGRSGRLPPDVVVIPNDRQQKTKPVSLGLV
jgi:hypothetical protein